jgi:hypothetical protein
VIVFRTVTPVPRDEQHGHQAAEHDRAQHQHGVDTERSEDDVGERGFVRRLTGDGDDDRRGRGLRALQGNLNRILARQRSFLAVETLVTFFSVL